MTNEQILELAKKIAAENSDIIDNFNAMIVEYKDVAIKAGIVNPVEELPRSAAFFMQVLEIVASLGGQNG